LGFAFSDWLARTDTSADCRPVRQAGVRGLYVALATGVFMVIGEPERGTLSFSFWLKMSFAGCLHTHYGGFKAAIKGTRVIGKGWLSIADDQVSRRTCTVDLGGIIVSDA